MMKRDADRAADAEGASAEGSAGSSGFVASPRPHPYSVLVGLVVTAIFIVLDQVTKQVAESALQQGEFVPLLGEHVGWQLVYNPGGAFGMPLPSWLFLLVTVVVLILVLRWLPRASSLTAAVAYGLLLAGAVGNVLDRLFRAGDPGFGNGHVVDFVAWGSFPRFNVADSAITVGFVLLVISLLLEERRSQAAELAASTAAASESTGSVSSVASDVAADPDADVAADVPSEGGAAAADGGVSSSGDVEVADEGDADADRSSS